MTGKAKPTTARSREQPDDRPTEKPDSTASLRSTVPGGTSATASGRGARPGHIPRPTELRQQRLEQGRRTCRPAPSDKVELARKWVYRAYQIVTPLNLLNSAVKRLNLVLPRTSSRVPPAAQALNKPAMVFGQFCNAGLALATTICGARSLLEHPGPAVFSHASPSTGSGAISRTSVLNTRVERARYAPLFFSAPGFVSSGRGGSGTRTRFDKHDDIVYAVRPVLWERRKSAQRRARNNRADVDPECDYYLDAIDAEYRTKVPQNIRYAGIRPIDLDGAIQQIMFSVGASGATTTIVRNSELMLQAVPYKVRRAAERQQARDRRNPVLGGGLGIF